MYACCVTCVAKSTYLEALTYKISNLDVDAVAMGISCYNIFIVTNFAIQSVSGGISYLDNLTAVRRDNRIAACTAYIKPLVEVILTAEHTPAEIA